MAAPTKQYGLIRLPKKEKNTAPKLPRASIFDDDSDEDGMAAVNREINRVSDKNKVKRQTQLEIDKALADDPNVYAYDELYDDMKEKEKEEVTTKLNQSKSSKRESRYIGGLMKAAEKRQKEHERRAEKKVQKERDEEGDLYADKEKFVTSAYKKKMAEMEALEAEERRKEELENMMDVTKQSDMSSFYRGLYKQTLGSDKTEEKKNASPVKDKVGQEEEEETPNQQDKGLVKPSVNTKNRKYRKRSHSGSSEQSETVKQRSRSRSKEREQQRNRSTSPRKNRSQSPRKNRSQSPRKNRSRSPRRNRSRSPRRNRSPRKNRSHSKERRRSSRSRSRNRHKEGSSRRKSKSRSPSRKHRKPGKDSAQDRRPDQDKQTSPDRSGDSKVGETKTQPPASLPKQGEEDKKADRFTKRNDSTSVQSARERYLARKAAKSS